MTEAQSRPRREYTPKPKPTMDYGEPEQASRGYAAPAANPPSYSAGKPLMGARVNLNQPPLAVYCCLTQLSIVPTLVL